MEAELEYVRGRLRKMKRLGWAGWNWQWKRLRDREQELLRKMGKEA